MKFRVDAQLPPALACFLRESGHEAVHVEEAGLLTADDTAIWDHAVRTGAAVITKDEDFAVRLLHDSPGPFVVWLRIGNCGKRALLNWFAPLLPAIESAAASGEAMIEVV